VDHQHGQASNAEDGAKAVGDDVGDLLAERIRGRQLGARRSGSHGGHSGLEVDALDGAPGVFSARYAPDAAGGNDPKNYEKLLRDLAGVPGAKRTARFVCCLALAFPDGAVRTFFGRAEGLINHAPKGQQGFGYDPVFVPEGFSHTFAEMTSSEKDALSHRGKAIEFLSEFLRSFLKH